MTLECQTSTDACLATDEVTQFFLKSRNWHKYQPAGLTNGQWPSFVYFYFLGGLHAVFDRQNTVWTFLFSWPESDWSKIFLKERFVLKGFIPSFSFPETKIAIWCSFFSQGRCTKCHGWIFGCWPLGAFPLWMWKVCQKSSNRILIGHSLFWPWEIPGLGGSFDEATIFDNLWGESNWEWLVFGEELTMVSASVLSIFSGFSWYVAFPPPPSTPHKKEGFCQFNARQATYKQMCVDLF